MSIDFSSARLNTVKTLNVGYRPEKNGNNYSNAVYIRPFSGDRSDEELNQLHDYLITLKTAGNIRTIEKRGWRTNDSNL